MYTYNAFDQDFVRRRAAQYRDQWLRYQSGALSEEEFRPLRLQNGWYVQRHAPMLRVAIPYGVLSAPQLQALAHIAREYDRGWGHFTTRQNIQFNWIALDRSADVMDALAEVGMHGIQTSGNCIRNTTTDAMAGVAPDEWVDPRPYCELIRQWSTLHPEFAFLPRKFKIAVSGAREDRAATGWHDIGLELHRNAQNEVGIRVRAGGGMGRTPLIAPVLTEFLPWQQILVYIEAIVRVYNRFGRRDNLYKARIKILVKAEGQAFIDAVNEEFRALMEGDPLGREHLLQDDDLDRISQHFADPPTLDARKQQPGQPEAAEAAFAALSPQDRKAFERWLERNVHAHRRSELRVVTLSLKRPGWPPGDVSADQMDAAARLSQTFSSSELRVSHDQNLVLPWVHQEDLLALWLEARQAGLTTPNIGLITDMIACPGGDYCALANARSLPLAEEVLQRFADIDEALDVGDIDLHISGCINSCGHHHSGHIGILGVDKDGQEWYQITLGGTDGSSNGPAARAGRVIGPAFAADEVADAIEAVIDAYRQHRVSGERFIQSLDRLGLDPFRSATQAVRRTTARSTTTEKDSA